MVSFTTGAPAAAYSGDADSLGDINKMVEMFSATAALCKLDYQGVMYIHGVSYAGRDDDAKIEEQREMCREYAAKVIAKIRSITE